MLKLEYRLNNGRITKEAKYQLEGIIGAVDKAFLKYDFRKEILKDGTICYYGNGQPTDYGVFGRLITTLKSKDWFLPYLDKWLWYNSDDGDSEDDFTIEDVLYHYTNKESVS